MAEDNAEQKKSLTILHHAIDKKLGSMKKVLESFQPITIDKNFKVNVSDGIQKTESIKSAVKMMSDNEIKLLHSKIRS